MVSGCADKTILQPTLQLLIQVTQSTKESHAVSDKLATGGVTLYHFLWGNKIFNVAYNNAPQSKF